MSPIITGLIGGLIAAITLPWLLKRSPSKLSKGQRRYVRKNYKRNTFIANASFIIFMILGLIVYKLNLVSRYDPRPLLIIVGLMGSVPLIAFNLPNKDGARNFSQSLEAYSMSQKSPVWLMLFLLVLFSAFGILGICLYIA